MFKAKRIEIDAAHDYMAILTEKKAKDLFLFAKDRIKIINKKTQKNVICVLEIASSSKSSNKIKKINPTFKDNEIAIFEKAFDKLEIKENEEVDIIPAKRPKSLEHINLKSKGKRLNEEQFKDILVDIVENRYSDIETTYFVIACTINGLSDAETIALTNAMVNVGKVLNFQTKKTDIVADKHCIGGVPGNRTSMIITPIIAAAGIKIPKSSSRSITSPAGTADTMEVLTNVDVDVDKMFKEVNEINGCIVWGGGLDLSPADDLIIHIEHPLEIDSQGQMLASVLSKKKSAGATNVLIDIPVGKTAKVNSNRHAKDLKKKFEKICKAIGIKVKVIITDGSQPIGNGIGPLLEALDVLKLLKNEVDAPKDLREKSLIMAGYLLESCGHVKKKQGYNEAKKILESGQAYKKFNEILKFQGKKELPKTAKFVYEVKAKKDGKIKSINNKRISKLAFMLGAPKDQAAGLYLDKKCGDVVQKGEVIYKAYSNSELKFKYGKAYLKNHIIYEY